MQNTRVVIIGGGPAGLTAAYELSRLGQPVTILEADPVRLGGISQTAQYKGYRFDIGGHRFFSKNKEIEKLWTEWLKQDMVRVARLSRILYRGKFFDYPLKALNAFGNLGLLETSRCVLSYLWTQIFPRKQERSFEDWVVNRFGYRLYSIFFKTYTEKVWGLPCDQIEADWASQRIKDLNLWKAAINALGLGRRGPVVKTLIHEFRYPRLGPGMMWEHLADRLVGEGNKLHLGHAVTRIHWAPGRAGAVEASGQRFEGDQFISTMPIRHLIERLDPPAPTEVLEAARGLKYRDYLTVALILTVENLFPDNWIYIHDPSVKVGRIQNYKNWSREMVPDEGNTCLGLEYFCDIGDELWSLSDEQLVKLGIHELDKLGLASPESCRDGTVVRMPRAYPVYDEGYLERIEMIRGFLDRELPNVQPVGRNGMHRYNNQDHAMWTGILAARNILGQGPYNLWLVNADAEYHEELDEPKDSRLTPSKLKA